MHLCFSTKRPCTFLCSQRFIMKPLSSFGISRIIIKDEGTNDTCLTGKMIKTLTLISISGD